MNCYQTRYCFQHIPKRYCKNSKTGVDIRLGGKQNNLEKPDSQPLKYLLAQMSKTFFSLGNSSF